MLKNSKIILHDDAILKVGCNYGYFDGGGFDQVVDICRINLVDSVLNIYGNVSIFPGTTINANKGEVTIKNNTIINGYTKIMCKSKIEIGENCVIAQGVIIRDDNGHKLGRNDKEYTNKPLKVIIKDNCWIGQNVTILKNVVLKEGTVVASGAIVTKDSEGQEVIAGIPAKSIEKNIQWQM